MSVYIKGMEMPKSCYACMFFAQTDYWNKEDEAGILSYCKRTGEKTWESVNGYLPNCPLVLVPPHGDLIWREWLINIALHLMNTAKNDDIANGVKWLWQYIIEATTIIPASTADKEETE